MFSSQIAVPVPLIKINESIIQLKRKLDQTKNQMKQLIQQLQSNYSQDDDSPAVLKIKSRLLVLAMKLKCGNSLFQKKLINLVESKSQRQKYLNELTNQQKQIERRNLIRLQTSQLEQQCSKSQSLLQKTKLRYLQAKMEGQKLCQLQKEAQQRVKRENILLQDAKGNIRVYCRLRPSIYSEKILYTINQNQLNITLKKKPQSTYRIKPADPEKHSYYFEKLFSENATQVQLFQELSQLVQCAIDGNNVCIFAYGQTGGGKTFTMKGNSYPRQNRGLIPRSFEYIFNRVQVGNKQGYKSQITLTVFEIYNSKIYDLLEDSKDDTYSEEDTDTILKSEYYLVKNKNKLLSKSKVTKDEQRRNCKFKQLFSSIIQSQKQGLKLINSALRHRTTDITQSNSESSRSHLVMQINIKKTNNSSENIDGDMSSCLVLIDLAGSERIKESKVQGIRQKETCEINTSLTELGRVMRIIKEGGVPSFRNNKLTEVLNQYLQQNGKAVLLVNISVNQKDLQQTINSLNFAESIRGCKVQRTKQCSPQNHQ